MPPRPRAPSAEDPPSHTRRATRRAMQEVAVDGTFRMPTTSHAVVHQGLVFVTGTLATRGSSFDVIGTGIRAETEQTIRNISEILAGCGSGLERILKTTVYLRDVEDFLD